MKIIIICIVLCIILACSVQNDSKNKKKEIYLIGSSVAAGWITSYEKENDLRNGWAYKLARRLKKDGYVIYTVARPGDNSQGVLERIEEDVLIKKPEFVIIALSLSNEGITGTNAKTVYDRFYANMKKIISLCKQYGVKPIIASCYACNEYTEREYDLSKRMNLQLAELKVPTINLLGALDNNFGQFPEGYYADESHPNNKGHEEMYSAINLEIFDNEKYNDYCDFRYHRNMLQGSQNVEKCIYVPKEIVRSFSLVSEIKNIEKGSILNLSGINSDYQLKFNENSIELIRDEITLGKSKTNHKISKENCTLSTIDQQEN